MNRLLELEDRHLSWLAFLRHEIPIQRANYRICCVVAMIFHRFIEKPLMRRLNGWVRSPRSAGRATA